MNTAEKYNNNVVEFPTPDLKVIRGGNEAVSTDSWRVKATAADPFRDMNDVHRMQDYFMEKKQYRNYLLLTLGISFALRCGDLLSLKLKDVYEKDGTPKNYFVVREEKTDKRNKIIINKKSKEVLTFYWGRVINRTYHDMSDPLFCSRQKDLDGNKRPLTIYMVDKILKKAADDLDIEDHISSHSFRKTYAYHLLRENNCDSNTLYALQYSFNHSDARITMKYSGIEDDVVTNLREQIGAML